MSYSHKILQEIKDNFNKNLIDENIDDEKRLMCGNDITFDYVIVGAGISGCVLAARLSENPKTRVLLIEAGQDPTSLPIADQTELKFPVTWPHVYFNASHDWNIFTQQLNLVTPPNYAVNPPFRRFAESRAKLLGGCSGHNAFGWSWGADYDYNNWGLSEWTYDKIMPYLKKTENCSSFTSSPNRGLNGPMIVKEAIVRKDIQKDWLTFTQTVLGLVRPNPDINAAPFDAQGWAWNQMSLTQNDNTRLSAYDAYIRPILGQRPNLFIKQKCTASKILFHKNTNKLVASGIKYLEKSNFKKVYANKEVLICGGALNTPKLLQLSGIGPVSVLEPLKIKVKLDSPYVGKNIQDHIVGVNYWAVDQIPGPTPLPPGNPFFPFEASQNFLEMEGFIKSDASQPTPNAEIVFFTAPAFLTTEIDLANGLLVSGDSVPPPTTKFFLGLGYLMSSPKSRGSLQITSNSILDTASITPPYFNDPGGEDIMQAVNMLKICHNFMTQFQTWNNALPNKSLNILSEEFPKPLVFTLGDNNLALLLSSIAPPSTHIIGGCKMGNDNDSTAVVDQYFKVKGVKRLRVIDGSVLPTLLRTRPQATIYAMAEKASDIIKSKI